MRSLRDRLVGGLYEGLYQLEGQPLRMAYMDLPAIPHLEAPERFHPALLDFLRE